MSSLLDLLTQERHTISVAELTAQISEILQTEFFDIWVEGEVSNFKRHSSGHWYFTLKDEQAQIRCAAFRNHNLYIRFRPEDGLKVRARGSISVYEPRGDYQLVVTSLEPVGKGALQLAYEQLKEQLWTEGLFDPAHKRPLPFLPKCIGIITSPTGAVIRDILQILRRRNSMVNVLIYPVHVQGEGAAKEIAAALAYLNTRTEVEVVILARGGGTLEDLWAFNEEVVARAIFKAAKPVISAIGHETDITIADFVADLRAPTPSAAAEIVAPHQEELRGQLAGYQQAMTAAFHYQLMQWRNQLAALRASRILEAVPSLVQRHSQYLDNLTYQLEAATRLILRQRYERLALLTLRLMAREVKSSLLKDRNKLQKLEARLQTALNNRLASTADRLAISISKLHTLSPLKVMARGYALVWNEQGRLIKSPEEVAQGERLHLELSGGTITCTKD